MRAVLRLEVIGDNYRHHLHVIENGEAREPHLRQYIQVVRYGRRGLRPWVVRIVDRGREFVDGVRDYTDANGTGSRGVFEYFALTPGIYEVNECVRLGKMRRYYIRVGEDATYEEIEWPISTI